MTGLEFILEKLRMPQKKLVSELNVPPASVSTWVNGKVEIPEKHMLKLMELTNVDSELIAKGEITEIDKVLIMMQIISASDPQSIQLPYLESKHRTLLVLDDVEKYISAHGLTKQENGAYIMDEDNILIQNGNIRRVVQFLELANSIDDKALDYLLTGMQRVIRPNDLHYEVDEDEGEEE